MNNTNRPLILYEGKYKQSDLEKLKQENKVWRTVDVYKKQLFELFEIENPRLRTQSDFHLKVQKFITTKTQLGDKLLGNWVYFPWSGVLVHCLGETDYEKVRTNRNRNLITEKEQTKLRDFCVGIVGLSVGNNIAVGLAYSGVSGKLKLAEHDILRTSNLNRLRAGLDDLGMPKINIASQQIYEINPYVDLKLFPNGLKKGDLEDFFNLEPKPQAIFDEIDDFEMKVRLRLKAKECGVPVMMLTNLGDNILVDVERYDQDKNLEIFNGLLGELPRRVLEGSITEKDKVKYAIQFVGLENIPTRALGSLLEINKTIVSRPQLFGTVTMSGGVSSYLVRKLALGESIKSGRTKISLDKIFDLTQNDSQRNDFVENIKKFLG